MSVQESLLAFIARLHCVPQVGRTASSQGSMHIFPRWMLVCFELCARSLNYIPLLSVINLASLSGLKNLKLSLPTLNTAGELDL